MNSVKIVEAFWTAVWKARNPDAIADFVTRCGNAVIGCAVSWRFAHQFDPTMGWRSRIPEPDLLRNPGIGVR